MEYRMVELMVVLLVERMADLTVSKKVEWMVILTVE